MIALKSLKAHSTPFMCVSTRHVFCKLSSLLCRRHSLRIYLSQVPGLLEINTFTQKSRSPKRMHHANTINKNLWWKYFYFFIYVNLKFVILTSPIASGTFPSLCTHTVIKGLIPGWVYAFHISDCAQSPDGVKSFMHLFKGKMLWSKMS